MLVALVVVIAVLAAALVVAVVGAAVGEVVKHSFLFFPGAELVDALDISLLRKPLSTDCLWREGGAGALSASPLPGVSGGC